MRCAVPNWLRLALLALTVCTGCRTTGDCTREHVAERVADRMGVSVGPAVKCGQFVWPNGVSANTPLDEEQAVLLALWNNAAFQEQLADLGIAHGDLVQAGLLPNPEFAYLFNAPDKPFRYLFEFPLESLWLRPIRIAAATRESTRTGQRLVQVALDLIRDTRQAYADVLLARDRLGVAEEAVRLRGDIAKLAEARLQAGDASGQEAATARIDALAATQDLTRLRHDVALTEERLRLLMGMGENRRSLPLIAIAPSKNVTPDVDTLVTTATAIRPDIGAASEAVAASEERLRISKLAWVRVLGILDATSGRNTGHEFAPAVRATVPIFNWNQGAIARAEAECAKATRACRTLHDQIVLEVRQAHIRFTQAHDELAILDRDVRPEVEAAIKRAEASYREGNAGYLIVLESTRQVLDSRMRKAQLEADLRRATAELERAVGRRLDSLEE